VEKNCYVDIWIEVFTPSASSRARFCVHGGVDFEGDQWTFFKPPHDELRELYGLDVQEMNVWRRCSSTRSSISRRQTDQYRGDAFWLPDTSGTDYRRQHTKKHHRAE